MKTLAFLWFFVLGPFTGFGILLPLLIEPSGMLATGWAWAWIVLHITFVDGSKLQKALDK